VQQHLAVVGFMSAPRPSIAVPLIQMDMLL